MADTIRAARRMFGQLLCKADPGSMPDHNPNLKDAQAQAAGHEGGLLGGPARAEKLSPERIKEIAQKAAKKRWHKP